MGPKRKVCPNPLFLSWLEEWKKEAEEKGLNSKWTYNKAMASIKKYPLPLRSGKEAKILENIGDGIARKLDERLNKHLQNGGDMSDLHPKFPLDAASPVKRRKKKSVENDDIAPVAPFSPDAQFRKANSRKYIPKFRSGAYALIITLYEECQKASYVGYMGKNELQQVSQHLCDKSMTMADAGSHYTAWSSMGTLVEKGYVIKKSSPAKYYITDTGCALAHQLLQGTAYTPTKQNTPSSTPQRKQHKKTYNGGREPLPEAGEGLLSELRGLVAELDKSKQSNHSFHSSSTITRPQHSNLIGSPENIHNLSNSGRTLGGKKSSNPMDFYDRLQANKTVNKPKTNYSNAKNVKNNEQTSSSNKININKPYNSNMFADTPDINTSCISVDLDYDKSCIDKSFGCVNLDKTYRPPSDFNYWYIQENSNETLCKTKALVTIDDTIGVGFLIKANKKDLEASGALFTYDHTRAATTDGYIFAYIADKDSREISIPPLNSNSYSNSSAPTIQSKTNQRSNSTVRSIQYSSSTSTSINLIAGHSSSTAINRIAGHSSSTSITTVATTVKPKPSTYSMPVENSSTVTQSRALSVNHETTGTVEKTVNCNPNKIDPKDIEIAFTLRPGMYDIILCVDVVETSGSGKRKKEMAEKLTKSGVKMNVRKLQLGDFLWIAKEKFGGARELVLDFIVERKRMDDLASSICDGRFREQKFRLKSCGLLKKIYLVEQYGSCDHFVVPEATLRQAIMNTQVIEGFFVKETSDIFDSVQYLSLMTAQLTNLYRNKTLNAVSMDTYKELKCAGTFEDVIRPDQQYLYTFDEFHINTDKNKVLTVREMFAKQLMQLKGVSTERALAITQNYPTPCLLLAAFNRCYSSNGKENLLSNIEFGKNKKKIGNAISKQVSILYNTLNT